MAGAWVILAFSVIIFALLAFMPWSYDAKRSSESSITEPLSVVIFSVAPIKLLQYNFLTHWVA